LPITSTITGSIQPDRAAGAAEGAAEVANGRAGGAGGAGGAVGRSAVGRSATAVAEVAPSARALVGAELTDPVIAVPLTSLQEVA